MLKFLTILASLAFFSTSASAADYGICANSIANEVGALIAPVAPVQTTSVVTDEVAVIVVKGKRDTDYKLGDSVIEVLKMYEPEFYSALKAKPKHVWIGIIEGIDGAGKPSLWMRAWAATSDGCIKSGVGERVYHERANAPDVFWKEVYDWEQSHPEIDQLVHSSS